MGEEMFDVVDEQDRVVGQMARTEVHRLGLHHRAVHVLVRNAKGEVFLQLRSRRKENHPGVWDSSSSGHVGAGEEYHPSALRELEEELGLVVASPALRPLRKFSSSPRTEWEHVWVYELVHEGPFHLQSEELDDGRWFLPAEVDRLVMASPQQFAPAFAYIWNELRIGGLQ